MVVLQFSVEWSLTHGGSCQRDGHGGPGQLLLHLYSWYPFPYTGHILLDQVCSIVTPTPL